jgi:DNA-binding NtrC family response regulator
MECGDVRLHLLDHQRGRLEPDLRAAEALGLERSHLYKKCQQLGIDLQSLRKQG